MNNVFDQFDETKKVNVFDQFDDVPNSDEPQGRLSSAGNSFVRGAGHVLSSVPKAIGEGAVAIANKFGDNPYFGNPEGLTPEDTTAYAVGQAVDDWVQKSFPTNPQYDDEFWASQLPSGLGSTVGFAAGGAASTVAKIPSMATVATLGAASSGVSGAEDYKQTMTKKGLAVDPKTRASSFGLNAIVGTSEAWPVEKLLRRLDQVTGGGVKEIITKGVKGGTEELIQELTQQIGGNLVANKVLSYDKERNTFEGAVESGEVGFSVGFLLNTLAASVGIKNRGASKAPSQAAAVAQGEVVGSPTDIIPEQDIGIDSTSNDMLNSVDQSGLPLASETLSRHQQILDVESYLSGSEAEYKRLVANGATREEKQQAHELTKSLRRERVRLLAEESFAADAQKQMAPAVSDQGVTTDADIATTGSVNPSPEENRVVESVAPLVKNDGSPYNNEKSARFAAKNKKIADYNVVSVGDGFGIQPVDGANSTASEVDNLEQHISDSKSDNFDAARQQSMMTELHGVPVSQDSLDAVDVDRAWNERGSLEPTRLPSAEQMDQDNADSSLRYVAGKMGRKTDTLRQGIDNALTPSIDDIRAQTPVNTVLADALNGAESLRDKIRTVQAAKAERLRQLPENQPRKKTANDIVNPEKDDILTAISKLGGITRADAETQGIDPAHFNERKGIKSYFTKNGSSFDAMAETLSQHGYFDTEKYTANGLLDMVGRALGGEGIYTTDGLINQKQRELEDEALQRADEDQDAIDAIAESITLENSLPDTQPAEQLVAQRIMDAMSEGVSPAQVRAIMDTDGDVEARELLNRLNQTIEAHHESQSQASESGSRSSIEAAEQEEDGIPGFGSEGLTGQTDQEIDALFGEAPLLTSYSEQDISTRENSDAEATEAKSQIDRESELFTLGQNSDSNISIRASNDATQQPQGDDLFSAPTANEISDKANQAATSPRNDLAEPTDGQKEAGNYKKGEPFNLHGNKIVIENPKDSTRSGKDADGKEWSNTMGAHYGDIKGTLGADGDALDVFVGENPENTTVWIIDQVTGSDRLFDEHKIMMGFADKASAEKAYRDSYDSGWDGIGAMTEMSVDKLNDWMTAGETTIALAYKPKKTFVKNKKPSIKPVKLNPDQETDEGMPIYELDTLYSFDERETSNLHIKQPNQGELPNEAQRDLFAPTNIPSDTAKTQSKDNFNLLYTQRETSTVQVGIDTVHTPSDAAHIFAPFRKHAQETFLALVTDRSGKILNLIRHTKGLKASSSVSPVEVVGAIAATEDAHHVWFGHNHPSGVITPSDADYKITEKLILTMDGMDLNYRGHVIVGDGKSAQFFQYGSTDSHVRNILASPRKSKLSVTERVLQKRDRKDAPQLSSPAAARKIVKDVEAEDALILLDNQNQLIGSLAMSSEEMRQLRTGGRIQRIFKALSDTNAAAAILKTQSTEAAANMARFLNGVGEVRLLDWLSGEGFTKSDAEAGASTVGSAGIFFSKSAILASGASPKGMGVKNVELAANAFIKKFKGADDGLKLRVHRYQDDAFGRDSAKTLGRVKGGFDPKTNTVTIIAGNIESASDLRETLQHEIIVHKGLGIFDKATQQSIVDAIAHNAEKSRSLKPLWEKVQKDYHDQSPQTQAEELLARVSETKLSMIDKHWNKIVTTVRNALIKIGLIRPDMSRRDLMGVIYTISDAFKEGRVARQRDAAPGLDVSENSSILFSRSNDQTFSDPIESRVDKQIRIWQDKFKPLKATQEEIEKVSGALPDEHNAYQAEEALHGKAEQDLVEVEEQLIQPLVDIMTEGNINQEELDLFLMAQHAKERNEYIATINDEMPDGGSGMKTAEADRIKKDFATEGKKEALQNAAQKVYAITARRRELLRESGLQADAQADAWEAMYEYYIPLKGFAENEIDADRPRIGTGFDIRGKESMRSLGRRSMAGSPTTYAIQDLSTSIIRHRKNEVGQTFLAMVEANPKSSYWEVFTDENPDVDRRYVNGVVKEQAVSMHMMKEDYLAVKRDGKEHFIKIKDKRLMTSMKNLGPEPMNAVVRTMGAVTRFLSSVNTSYNPEFMVSNMSRDIQTALFNTLAEQDIDTGKIKGKKLVKDMAKGVPSAIRAIWSSSRKKDLTGQGAETQQYYQEFLEDGAKTGYFDSKDLDGIASDLSDMVSMAQGGAKGNLLKFKKSVLDFVEHGNNSIENGVRLSAYIEARRNKVSRKKAASFAKNLTVNFNRKGEVGAVLNSLYMFANASIQGTANFARVIANFKVNEDGSKSLNMAQKMAGGIMGAAYLLAAFNRAGSEDDDDGENFYDKVPTHVRERNLVIMKSAMGVGNDPKAYWTIPLPYGYNIFYNIGDAIEASIHSGSSKRKDGLMWDVLLSAVNSFSPIGVHGGSPEAAAVLTIMPTVLSPFVEIEANTNHFGGQIYRENYQFGAQKADSALSQRSTKEAYKKTASWLNEITGGSDYRSGGLDLSPDTIEHMVEFGAGGLYRLVDRSVETVDALTDGRELEIRNIPFWRKVNGGVLPYEDISEFYDARQELDNLKAEAKSLSGPERLKFRRANKDKMRLADQMKASNKRMGVLRKRRDAIESDKNLTDKERDLKLRGVLTHMKEVVDRFDKEWRKAG